MRKSRNELLNAIDDNLPTNIFTIDDEDPMVILGKLNEIIHWLENATAEDLNALPLSTKYGADISLALDDTTFIITAQLKDQDGNNLGTAKTIDLPLEATIVSGSYDSVTKTLVLTLKSGSDIEIPLGDLISGLQETLISGTNIKTINNISVLGNGNIDTTQLYWVTYGTTPYEDITTALNNGKLPICLYNNMLYYYTYKAVIMNTYNFFTLTSVYIMYFTVAPNSDYSSTTSKSFVFTTGSNTIGGTTTFSANPILNNNKYLQGKNTSGQARNLIGNNSSNDIEVGATNVGLILNTYSNVIPSVNNTKNLGSQSTRWKTVYATNLSDGTKTATVSDLIARSSAPIYEHTICDNNIAGHPVLVIYTHDSTPITTPAQLRAIYDPNNTGLTRRLPMLADCFIGFGSMAIYASMSFDGSQNDSNLISYGVYDVSNQTVTTVYLTNIDDIVRTI